MAGTSHFSRIQYHFDRGLREIVAPRQVLKNEEWNALKKDWQEMCVYCAQSGNKENRGIVPDHLVPVTSFGELVLGNVVPACQSCNDSRGDMDWRLFLKKRHPGDGDAQIARIEEQLVRNPYIPAAPHTCLTDQEHEEYEAIRKDWGFLIRRARVLRDTVKKRRTMEGS